MGSLVSSLSVTAAAATIDWSSLVWTLAATAHLICVGVASFGPLVSCYLEWTADRRRRRAAANSTVGEISSPSSPASSPSPISHADDREAIARSLARWSLGLAIAGAALGIAIGLLLWLRGAEPYFAALRTIPARRLWFGGAEFVFYLLCMAGYLGLWTRLPRWAHRALAILAGTNLLYHFPPLFSAVAVISLRPELWGEELPYGRLMGLFGEPEILARVTHWLLAGWATCGVALAGIALRPTAPPSPARQPLMMAGGRMALFGVVLEIPAGILVLVTMPAAGRDRVLLGDPLATAALATGLLAMVGLLHHLAALAWGDVSRSNWLRSAGLLALVLFSMVAVSHRNRLQSWEAAPPPTSAWSAPGTHAIVRKSGSRGRPQSPESAVPAASPAEQASEAQAGPTVDPRSDSKSSGVPLTGGATLSML